jgi:dihydrofolate synthase/folylpolyglutamate synthase
MTSKEALEYIDSLDKFGINLGLSRIAGCMAALGNPQSKYPTAHVAGTNGKGSVCAMTSSILSASGRRTGLYTSPPLESFGERMRIDGELLPEEKLPALLEEVLGALGANPVLAGMTQFEIITAVAFLYFAREKADFAVIEVGMGGRLDSTNVITPKACAITNVSLEHSEQLGSTEALIAREKAGIAKRGVPLVTGARDKALEEIIKVSNEVGAPLYVLGKDFVTEERGRLYDYRGISLSLKELELGLPGSYQKDNLAVALALVEGLISSGVAIDEEDIRTGLKKTRWAGRLELFGKGPRILLDGAHNPHAAEALSKALQSGFPRKKLILVLGILGDKDAVSIVRDLAPLADEIILTRSESRRAISPAELKAMSEGVGIIGARVAETLQEAYESALKTADDEDLILITGSLTLVGQARAILRREGWLS